MKDENHIPEEKQCFLLIIPFSTLEQAESIPDVKCYARNVLKVDDEYYEKILLDYKIWMRKQNEKRKNN